MLERLDKQGEPIAKAVNQKSEYCWGLVTNRMQFQPLTLTTQMEGHQAGVTVMAFVASENLGAISFRPVAAVHNPVMLLDHRNSRKRVASPLCHFPNSRAHLHDGT